MRQEPNDILFGKYEIISTLGTGSFGTVYLSKHTILECYRAIKIIPKTTSMTDSLIHEAQLLKSLQHPGIPCLYDIEEDESTYYLIEEYVEGESLEQFLLHQPNISQNTFLDLSLQLCNIFQYLHNLKPSPILYLDLKPEHIIVCGMQIKLIDFNVATFLSNLGNISTLFGNEVFSAPELALGKLNLQSDIYSIGKILQNLSTHVDVPISPNIHKILQKATAENPNHRLETVDDLILAMEQEKITFKQTHSRKKIAIVGSHAGCGSTHIAFSLVSTLNYMGYQSIYYEQRTGDSLRKLDPFLFPMKETNGMICYRYFKGFPCFGPGVSASADPAAEFSVYDFGNSLPPEDMDFDAIFLICSNGIWHWHDAFQKGEILQNLSSHLIIICNMAQKNTMHCFSKQFAQEVYYFPYEPSPFGITSDKILLFSKLLQIKRRSSLFFHLRNKFIPKK
ncbi:MAG: serine/threonine protein kinase [Agathobacter sp.]|nr:serine/threonine protein kinase [Agathobacter sp.]